jgi:hypothetical protein
MTPRRYYFIVGVYLLVTLRFEDFAEMMDMYREEYHPQPMPKQPRQEQGGWQ